MSYHALNKQIIIILSKKRKSECHDDFALFSLRFSDSMEKVEKKAKRVMSYFRLTTRN
jgi:hypothetical protein